MNEPDNSGKTHVAARDACLSCGAMVSGAYCPACGQKNDDLRRSLFSLARDFVEDMFSFDGRMWRTLGALVSAPGSVARNYAHGKRSRYTPPVRLFLVVSFLFFLVLSVTQTLFAAVEVTAFEAGRSNGVTLLRNPGGGDAADAYAPELSNCEITVKLRLFVRTSDLERDQEKWLPCIAVLQAKLAESSPADEQTASQATSLVIRLAEGVKGAVDDPETFNAAFNDWLPRVMFLMAPIAALIMGLFIRNRNALFFDHMVLALYNHAVAFFVVGAAVAATQIGVPGVGLAAAFAFFIYYVIAVKRAYDRGWVKTIYSSVAAGVLYFIVVFIAVYMITVRIVLAG